MSTEDQFLQFDAHVGKYVTYLKSIIAMGWALLAGAFSLGIWVASLELRQAAVNARFLEAELNVKSHTTELNGVAIRQAVVTNDLAYIKSAVERIEKKVGP